MTDNDYDYESLGDNTSMTQNALAGALAGIAEHCAMYPVDSIKVKEREHDSDDWSIGTDSSVT